MKMNPQIIFTVLIFFLFKLRSFDTIQVQTVAIFLNSKPKNIYYPFSQQTHYLKSLK